MQLDTYQEIARLQAESKEREAQIGQLTAMVQTLRGEAPARTTPVARLRELRSGHDLEAMSLPRKLQELYGIRVSYPQLEEAKQRITLARARFAATGKAKGLAILG